MDSITGIQRVRTIESVILNNTEHCIQAAILNSLNDKEFRSRNITGQIEQCQMAEVSDGQHISMIYYQNQLTVENKDTCNAAEISVRNKIQPYFGILLKKSPHWIQGYTERQCSIINRVFRYFGKETNKLEGVLNFDVQTYQLIDVKDKWGNILEFIIKPIGKIDKVFQFKGSNIQETTQWFNIIQIHLQDSLGSIKKLTSLCLYERFWRYERISSQQLEEEAEDGDIILFRGKDINCLIQRAFTQDDYDHVGILLKLENNNLYIFEALPMHGVGLCRWSHFILREWYKLYDKIVLRRLKADRNFDFKAKLSDFVNENVGKKYSITPTKLFTQKSTILSDSNQRAELNKKRTYFCSELVAKCYKQLGFLDPKVSSTQFWPGSFSQNNTKLQLNQATLSDEYLIDFQI